MRSGLLFWSHERRTCKYHQYNKNTPHSLRRLLLVKAQKTSNLKLTDYRTRKHNNSIETIFMQQMCDSFQKVHTINKVYQVNYILWATVIGSPFSKGSQVSTQNQPHGSSVWYAWYALLYRFYWCHTFGATGGGLGTLGALETKRREKRCMRAWVTHVYFPHFQWKWMKINQGDKCPSPISEQHANNFRQRIHLVFHMAWILTIQI